MDKEKRILGACWSSEKDYLQYCELQKKDRQYITDKILELSFHYSEDHNGVLVSLPDVLRVLRNFE